jgi:hypothetical protein
MPLQLRVRGKATSIMLFLPDCLIEDSGVPISFERRELLRPANGRNAPDSKEVRSSGAPSSDRRFTEMLFSYRLLVVGLLSVGIAAATTAHAGTQLFEGSLIV